MPWNLILWFCLIGVMIIGTWLYAKNHRIKPAPMDESIDHLIHALDNSTKAYATNLETQHMLVSWTGDLLRKLDEAYDTIDRLLDDLNAHNENISDEDNWEVHI